MHQLSHIETNWQAKQYPLIIACDNWQDPRNVGMAFRLADAFGIQEIWLGGGSPIPPNKKLSKTARSTQKWISYQHFPDLAAALHQAKKDGHHIWAIEITTSSKSIEEIKTKDVPQPLVLVLGAESKGISEEILACTDACYHIPMLGKNTSLNVATAMAIVLFSVSGRMKKHKKTDH